MTFHQNYYFRVLIFDQIKATKIEGAHNRCYCLASGLQSRNVFALYPLSLQLRYFKNLFWNLLVFCGILCILFAMDQMTNKGEQIIKKSNKWNHLSIILSTTMFFIPLCVSVVCVWVCIGYRLYQRFRPKLS